MHDLELCFKVNWKNMPFLLLPASLSCTSKLTLNFNKGSTKFVLCFNRFFFCCGFFFAIQSSSPSISDRFSKLNMKTEMIFNIMFLCLLSGKTCTEFCFLLLIKLERYFSEKSNGHGGYETTS